jgi:hypothetical protein
VLFDLPDVDLRHSGTPFPCRIPTVGMLLKDRLTVCQQAERPR